MKLPTKISNLFDHINGILTFWGSSLLVFIMLLISADVVMRYFLRNPIRGAIEISTYAMVYMTFLGAAWLLKREGHVKMDVVLNQLNPRAQAVVNISTSILGIVIWLVVTWYSGQATWRYFQTAYFMPTVLESPKWPLFVIIPVGSFLLSIQLLRRTYGYFRSWKSLRDKAQSSLQMDKGL